MTLIPPPSALPPGSVVDAYLRDSGGEKQELSTAQQETEIRAWCQTHKIVLHHIYTDEAITGSSDENRAALGQMMNALRHGGEVDGVIVWSNSRFARNATHAQFYRSEIRKLGYVYHSLTDITVEGPEAIIFEALIDYKNQQFLKDLSIDTKRGLRSLVESHGCVPGVPPRGFKREKVQIGQHRSGKTRTAHRWVIDPEFAPRVRKAFEMRAAGASLGQIQKETRLYGSINSYRTFWPNKLYIGTLVYGELTIENYCDPIVPLKIWKRVQEIQKHYAGHHHVSANSSKHPRRVNSNYLLSGLARCARCGSPLFGRTSKRKSGKRYTAYFCSRAYRQRDCTKQRIPGETLENAVIEKLREIFLKPEYLLGIQESLKVKNSGREKELEEERRQLNAELGTLRRQITHLTDAIAASGHSPSLLQRLSQLEADETELRTRLAENYDRRQAATPHDLDLRQLKERISIIDTTLQTADLPTKRAVLRGIVHSVHVDREGKRLFGTITVYYPPGETPPKGKPPAGNTGEGLVMPISQTPSGPPRYRHKIYFDTPTKYKSRSH